jgi:NADH:ubiquinone oxidoreductase subunit 5 (subunit L)/multisubunit Na+/H+ antiporter MnhA subunit
MMTRANNHGPKQAFWTGRLSALLPWLIFVWFVFQLPHIGTGGRMQASLPWVPSLGVELKAVLDGLAVLYGLIITGVGTLVMVYADGCMGRHLIGRAAYRSGIQLFSRTCVDHLGDDIQAEPEAEHGAR